MAFYGKSFSFNSVPCEAYELMIYDAGSTKQGDSEFASTVTVEEEIVGKRWKPYFYGVKYEKKLEIELVFGVNDRRLDMEKYLDRYEINEIASWLTGHEEYLWLEIEQPDMMHMRYHCICTELRLVSYGNVPYALQAMFVCDSPYAYTYPTEYTYTVNGTLSVNFFNQSCMNGYYRPNIEIINPVGNFSITNVTDGNYAVTFSGYPASITHIYMDNDHGIITNDMDLNIYPYFNYHFFRLKRGFNQLQISGNGTLKITCSFPVNTGG